MPQNLEITISNTGQVSTPLQVNNAIPNPTEFSPATKLQNGNIALVATAGIQLAKRASRVAVSQIGDFTGNREAQNRINNTLKIVEYVGSVAQGATAGFAFGGFVGAGVGAGVGAAQVAFDVVSQQLAYENQVKVDNLNRSYARDISRFANNNKRSGGNE